MFSPCGLQLAAGGRSRRVRPWPRRRGSCVPDQGWRRALRTQAVEPRRGGTAEAGPGEVGSREALRNRPAPTAGRRCRGRGTGRALRRRGPEVQRARPRARVADGAAHGGPGWAGSAPRDSGSGPPDADARAQQSRPAAASRCPAPARDPPDGLSVSGTAARPWDRAEPCPDKLPGRGPSPPGALYTLGGVLARGSGTSRAGRPGAGGGSGC